MNFKVCKYTSVAFLVVCLHLLFIFSTPATASKVFIDDLQITTAPDDQSQPDVTYDTINNKYFVVWSDSRSGGGIDLFGRFIQPGTSTGVNTPTTLIDTNKTWTVNEWAGATVTITAGTGVGQERTIVSNTANILTVTAVWDTGNTPDTTSRYAITGKEITVSNATGNQTQPKVAFDNLSATKRYLAVWTDSGSGVGRIYGQYIDVDGTVDAKGNFQISQSIDPSGTVTYSSEMSPSITFDSATRKFVVSWLDTTDAEILKYAEPLPITGICGDASSPKTFYYFPPTVADTLMVRSRDVDYADVQAAAQADGSKLTSTITDRSKFYFVEQFTPKEDCSMDKRSYTLTAKFFITKSEGSPVISYSPTDGSIYNLWSSKGLTSNLTVNWAKDCISQVKDASGTLTCTKWPDSFVQTGPTYTTAEDKTLIIYGRAVRLGIANDIVLSDPAKSSFNPAIAFDPFKNMWLATWETQTDSCLSPTTDFCKDVYGQLIDMQNYQQYGNIIEISKQRSDQTYPRVSYDAVNQRYLVVWEDARSCGASISNMDIFGQFIDPQGKPSGSNFPVTVAPGNQISPAVNFGDVDSRKFLVVWKDGRVPSDANIYGQMWDYSVAPQLLITDENNVQIYNQALNFGSVDVNLPPSVKKFRIWNNGNSQLTINNILYPDSPFTLLTSKPTTISPGVYYEMQVQFAPMAGGSFSGNATNNYKISISSDGGSIIIYLSGNGINAGTLSITTTSLPDAGRGVPYSQTLAAKGGTWPYVWSIPPLDLPAGLTLNPTTGEIKGTPTTEGTSTFTAQVTDTNGAGTSATRSLSIKVTSVGVSTTSLVPWTQNVPGYTQTLTAAGGTPPYTWTLTAGTLPSGLTLSTGGVLSGTPADAGGFSFTVKATDSTNSSGSKDLSLSINPAPAIITTSLPSTVVGASYSAAIVVAGGTSPISWSKTSGSLPLGISLNAGSGQLTGTPTASGSPTFTITVKDKVQAQMAEAGISATFTITVNGTLNIDPPTTPTGGSTGTYYSQTISTSLTGLPPYIWSIVQGALPDGLSLAAATGVISGTPTASGNFYFTVQVQDSLGLKAQKTLSILIAYVPAPSPAPTPTTPSTSGGGGGGGGCFIATAAFGSYLDPHVMVLREFRDRFLLTNKLGQVFVDVYYTYSPIIAAYISKHESLKSLTRLCLTPVVYAIKYPTISGMLLIIFVLFGIAILGTRPLRKSKLDSVSSTE